MVAPLSYVCSASISIRRCRINLKPGIIGNAGQLIFREQSATLEQLERGQYILNEVNSLLNNSSPDASSQSSSAYAFNLYQNKSAGALKALEVCIRPVFSNSHLHALMTFTCMLHACVMLHVIRARIPSPLCYSVIA